MLIVGLSQGSGGRDEEAAVSRYSSQYEQRLDPFSAFNQRVGEVKKVRKLVEIQWCVASNVEEVCSACSTVHHSDGNLFFNCCISFNPVLTQC